MKILSVTLTSGPSSKLKGALESVKSVVDAALILDTGITDDSLDVARQVLGEDHVFVEKFSWTGSFADARNAALDAAFRGVGGPQSTVHSPQAEGLQSTVHSPQPEKTGDQSVLAEGGRRKTEGGPVPPEAAWALMLDTDERYDWRGLDLRAYLESSTAPGHHVRDRSESYPKEHVFRLPARHKYAGVTHEAYPSAGFTELPQVRVWELPKTPKELVEKLQRDAQILEEETKSAPSARSWFYLAQTRGRLATTEEARQHGSESALFAAAASAWEQAYKLSPHDSEAGWCAYQAARCLYATNPKSFLELAVARCASGMTKHAGMPELPWYAAELSFARGDFRQAVRWATVAAALAEVARREVPTGFTEPACRYDAPYEVLKKSYEKLGRKEEALRAEATRRELMMKRLLGSRAELIGNFVAPQAPQRVQSPESRVQSKSESEA